MFAAATRWGRTLAHGMMLYSIVVHLIRTELLPGSVELEQDLVFPGPIFAGDELVIDAEIVHVDRALRPRRGARARHPRRRRRRLRGAHAGERRCLTMLLASARSLERTFAARDVADFAALIGGNLDGGEHVPTGLVGGLFSHAARHDAPGRGTNWMKQTLRFRSRARIGEPLTATVEIVRLRPTSAW